jgi:CheY-like chemotaxis protein
MTRPKLLLADDSVTIREIVERTFTDEGFDVTTVTNGEDAMWKFTEVEPDIVILDVNMPEPTGYKICEMIKQDETTRHLPVLLVVGSYEPFDQNEAERVGADGFLTKPFHSIRDLIVRVEELIGKPNMAASPAETADINNLIDRSFSELPEDADEPPVEMGVVDEVDEPPPEKSLAENVPESPAEVSLTDGIHEPWVEISTSDDVHERPVDVRTTDDMDEQPVEMNSSDVVKGIEISDEIAKEVTDAVPQTSYSARDIGGDDEILIAAKVDVEGQSLNLRDAFEPPMMIDDGPGVIDYAKDEPTEEFISLVTRRVIEKLSDKAVREIAREAVPRIAEKLIREALEQEKKS